MSSISTLAVAAATSSLAERFSRASMSRRSSLSRSIVVLALMTSLVAASVPARAAEEPSAPLHRVERHMKPIVNGHHIQPTQADLPRPEMSSGRAAVVDELYRELTSPRRR
jgi:hypothetical protein